MTIDMEPFTEGVTKPLALPTEETKDVELIRGNLEKIIKIRIGFGEPFWTRLI